MSNILKGQPEEDTRPLRKTPRKPSETPMPVKMDDLQVQDKLRAVLEEPRLERTAEQEACARAVDVLTTALKEAAAEGKSKEEVQALVSAHEEQYPTLKADLPDVRASIIPGTGWKVLVSLKRRTGQYEITVM